MTIATEDAPKRLGFDVDAVQHVAFVGLVACCARAAQSGRGELESVGHQERMVNEAAQPASWGPK